MEMERKYEIFLSSTFEDLKEERLQLINKILDLRHIPSGMEFFPTGPKDIVHIQARIRKVDIFVIVVGWRYGSKTKRGKTYTRFEYDYAKSIKKPILVFILDEEERKEYRAKMIEGEERKHDDELREFINYILNDDEGGTKRLVKFFSLKKEKNNLTNLFESSLIPTTESLNNKGGWIRSHYLDKCMEDYGGSLKTRNNPFFKKIAEKLNEFDLLSKRCTEKVPELKIEISEFFLKEYLAKLMRANIRNIFLESGSSIAYLSGVFLKRLKKDKWFEVKAPLLRIKTNNILSYLDIILSSGVNIELYPYAPPESKYGATFGDLCRIVERNPPKKPREIDTDARPAMKAIEETFRNNYSHNGIVFMAVSGIELSNENGFQGPHVGSYYNKLFKRAIFESECPVVLFMDETKMAKRFHSDTCYPICNFEKTFTEICETIPFAIALSGYSEKKLEEFEKTFREFKLNNVDKRERKEDKSTYIYSLIVSNDKFQALFNEEIKTGNSK